jgi:hypothetical protein
LPDFCWYNKPKRGKYIKTTNIPNVQKIHQIALKYTKIFHSKVFKKYLEQYFGTNIHPMATLEKIAQKCKNVALPSFSKILLNFTVEKISK